jgi:hypothetical protein
MSNDTLGIPTPEFDADDFKQVMLASLKGAHFFLASAANLPSISKEFLQDALAAQQALKKVMDSMGLQPFPVPRRPTND